MEPILSPTYLLPMLEKVADGMDMLFENDGIHLSLTLPVTCDSVLIDRERTAQALSSVLLTAHSMSRSGDTVELVASDSLESVLVEVRNSSLNKDMPSAEARVGMAVAEANFQSQQVNYSWSIQPFKVLIELQKAPALH
jgi:hypothetical protein